MLGVKGSLLTYRHHKIKERGDTLGKEKIGQVGECEKIISADLL
jgi:hypothetical protein